MNYRGMSPELATFLHFVRTGRNEITKWLESLFLGNCPGFHFDFKGVFPLLIWAIKLGYDFFFEILS